jgi:hypothetical protein
MAKKKLPLGVRVADTGIGGTEFEIGWTEFEGGGVTFGEATGDPEAGPADFVVAKAKLSRVIRSGLGAGPASKFLQKLLAGTQTTPVDVEVRTLDADGKPTGRGFLFQIAVPTSYTIDTLDAGSRDALTETFEFVAKDVQIVR